MAIKMIAMDIDGTFLRDDKTYDKARFQRDLDEMNRQGIHFVFSSGNQYEHTKSIIEGIDTHNDVSYIVENGAEEVDSNGKIINEEYIDHKILDEFIDALTKQPMFKGGNKILSGEKGAYIPDDESETDKRNAGYYYANLHEVKNLKDVKDRIFKISLGWDTDDVTDQMNYINEHFKGKLRGTSSGRGGIDVVKPNVSKALGIHIFEKMWNITSDEVAAFGDSGNDLEMLRACKYGIAMRNADPKLKSEVHYTTEYDNNHDGVLETIERILENKPLESLD